MARIYAGILGPLAFLTSLAHGALHARTTDAILFSAWMALIAFAAAGYVIGGVAERLIEEEVHGRISPSEPGPNQANANPPSAG